MFTFKNALVLLSVTLVITLSAASVSAVSLPFYDDFEDTQTGYYPVQNGWQTFTSGVTAYVTDTVSFSPSQSLLLHSYSYWTRCDFVPIDALPDQVSYDASLLMDPNPGRIAFLGLATAASGQMLYHNSFSVYSNDGLTGFVLFKGDVSVPPIEVAQFNVGDWVTLGADLDFVSLTADIWVDGELAAVDLPIQPKEFDDISWGHLVLDRFAVAESNWSGGRIGMIYLDDVAIFTDGSTLPEPPVVIDAAVELSPSNLKLNNRGKFVICHLELPEGYFVEDVDISSLLLNEAVPAALMPVSVGDFDADGIPDLTVKFDRQALLATLSEGEQEVVLDGWLIDDTLFSGYDIISVKP